MSKLSQQDRSFLSLLQRSPDQGEGWRHVSSTLWVLVDQFGSPELLEREFTKKKVRLSEIGRTVIKYI